MSSASTGDANRRGNSRPVSRRRIKKLVQGFHPLLKGKSAATATGTVMCLSDRLRSLS